MPRSAAAGAATSAGELGLQPRRPLPPPRCAGSGSACFSISCSQQILQQEGQQRVQLDMRHAAAAAIGQAHGLEIAAGRGTDATRTRLRRAVRHLAGIGAGQPRPRPAPGRAPRRRCARPASRRNPRCSAPRRWRRRPVSARVAAPRSGRRTSAARLPRWRSATWSALLAAKATRLMPPAAARTAASAASKAGSGDRQRSARGGGGQRRRGVGERRRPGMQGGQQVGQHHQPIDAAERRRGNRSRAPLRIGVVAVAQQRGQARRRRHREERQPGRLRPGRGHQETAGLQEATARLVAQRPQHGAIQRGARRRPASSSRGRARPAGRARSQEVAHRRGLAARPAGAATAPTSAENPGRAAAGRAAIRRDSRGIPAAPAAPAGRRAARSSRSPGPAPAAKRRRCGPASAAGRRPARPDARVVEARQRLRPGRRDGDAELPPPPAARPSAGSAAMPAPARAGWPRPRSGTPSCRRAPAR